MNQRAILPTPLIEGIAANGKACREVTNDATRKKWGQYFTGPSIATFMASLLPAALAPTVRVLDPGAGTGILGLAAAEHLISRYGASVHLVSVEPEPDARTHLSASLANAAAALGPSLTYEVLDADFLELEQPLLGSPALGRFDYVISNPPYFKLSPSEPRGGDAPNIYARFMEVSATLLEPGGTMCFIVPRSFASGVYFRRFRGRMRSAASLTHVHLFESRRDAFKGDGVLQENVIVIYTKGEAHGPVSISVSSGEFDLGSRWAHEVERNRVFAASDRHSILFLPTSRADLEVMDIFEEWTDTLDSHGLQVSTGPVVPFRAEHHLVSSDEAETVPLLWLQHVRAGLVTWPLGKAVRKPEHIRSTAGKLLVPNDTYVLMRRFSAKEEARRLVAAPLLAGQLPGKLLGLENHLNFIHRPGGRLSQRESMSLAILLNSRLFDNYFRISNGNTQVSATELRAMPLPSPEALTVFASQLQAREAASALHHEVSEAQAAQA